MKQLNKQTVEKLHAAIPYKITTRFNLKVDIDYRYGIFRFEDSKLEYIYLFIMNNDGYKYIMKYSFPELEFLYIYINKEIPNWGVLEKRYDKHFNVDADYEWYMEGTHNPNKYLTVKIKDYDKDGKVTEVYSPYVLADGIAPINIDPISPYIEEMHHTYRYFYKEKSPSTRYIAWEECKGCEKKL